MARISKERIHELVDLVIEANKVLDYGYVIGLELEKYGADLNIWTEEDDAGTNYFCYDTTSRSYKNKNIETIHDPALEKGEAHVRRLMKEKEGEENDTV